VNGLRKFVIAMYFGTACFGLCYANRLTSHDTMLSVTVLAGLYKAANVLSSRYGKPTA
jgi:hypothetical protein